jgi:hypothetical protein
MRRRDLLPGSARPFAAKEIPESTLAKDNPSCAITIFVVSGPLVLTANTSTLADSKSAAEFLLRTCLPAMDNVSSVGTMAQEGNWTPKPDSPPTQFRTSNSRWEVIKDEEKFSVNVWISHFAQQDYNICFVNFLSNNVNREEFLEFITTSLELTLFSDTRLAEIQMRWEQYRIKSDRPNAIQFGIQSQIADGSVKTSSITEMPRLVTPPVVPAAPPQDDR